MPTAQAAEGLLAAEFGGEDLALLEREAVAPAQRHPVKGPSARRQKEKDTGGEPGPSQEPRQKENPRAESEEDDLQKQAHENGNPRSPSLPEGTELEFSREVKRQRVSGGKIQERRKQQSGQRHHQHQQAGRARHPTHQSSDQPDLDQHHTRSEEILSREHLAETDRGH